MRRVVLSLLLPNVIIALHISVVGRQRMPILHRSSRFVLATAAQEQVEQAWRAKLSPELSAEASEQAWHAMLDDQIWTNVVTIVSAQVMSAATAGLMEAEGAAKQAWLAHLDAPTWGAVAAAVAEVAARVAEPEPSRWEAREAKRVWLARLDASSWATGAATLVEVAGDAAAIKLMREGCDIGQEGACERLGQQEAVMRARLGQLDPSTWGAVSAAVATIAVEVTLQSTTGLRAKDIAQAEWLVQLDTATWRQSQSASLRGMDLRGEMLAEGAEEEDEEDWVKGRVEEEEGAFRARREAAMLTRNAEWEEEKRALRAEQTCRSNGEQAGDDEQAREVTHARAEQTEEEKREAYNRELLRQIEQADAMDERLEQKNQEARRAKGFE